MKKVRTTGSIIGKNFRSVFNYASSFRSVGLKNTASVMLRPTEKYKSPSYTKAENKLIGGVKNFFFGNKKYDKPPTTWDRVKGFGGGLAKTVFGGIDCSWFRHWNCI